MDLSDVFKVFSEEIRLRIFSLLLEKELCVCDIESALEISQANASRHLSRMKSAGVLSSRKSAQWVYYEIDELFLKNHSRLVGALRHELKESTCHRRDLTVLKELEMDKERPDC